MAFDNLLVERDGATLVLTINRPNVLNALNTSTLAELRLALLDLASDEGVRVVILTGAGDRAFVAGADIKELAELTAPAARDHARRGQGVFELIERLGKPVIAAVNGFALGGGCELALACTIRIAAEHAKFGQPEVNLGLLPGFAGTQRLSRLVGKGRALEMMLTGVPIGAAEAERIGLVTRVVPGPALLGEARKLAGELAAKAPLAVRAIIDAVNTGTEMTTADGSAYEAALFGVAAATDDWREGTRAFLEKRPPAFKGR
jgi:enoyl-CoA hydratase/carnithine racemase